MIRVAFVTSSLGAGGAEAMLHKVATRLDRARFAPAVFCLTAGGVWRARLEEAGIPVWTPAADSNPAWRVAAVLEALRRFRPDVLQGWMYHGCLVVWFGRLLVARKAAMLWGIRQGLRDLRAQKPGTQRVIRWLARMSPRAHAIVYNSHVGAAEHHGCGFASGPTRVIPNGFDLRVHARDPEARDALRREWGFEADAFVVGFVARFHPDKDHRTLLNAFAELERGRPGARLVLVGTQIVPENVTLAAWLSESRLERQVLLLGERSDVPRILAALDVAVCISLNEGFPNVVGEAMATEVVCVVSDVGDCAAVVGDTGLVVPVRDAPALAAALAKLADAGKEALADMGRRARARVVGRYSIDAVVREYERLYASFSGGR